MIVLEDILLPEPYDTHPHVCLSSYRVGRRTALRALRAIDKDVLKIEAEVNEHEAKFGNQPMPDVQSTELTRRLHFAGESCKWYRQRLVFLRRYRLYAQHVHGPT